MTSEEKATLLINKFGDKASAVCDEVINELLQMPNDTIMLISQGYWNRVKEAIIQVGKPNIIKYKKDRLYKLIKYYEQGVPNKFPKQLYNEFFAYWSETSKDGKKIRYDDEKFFDIGKRMATFMKNTDPVKLSKMWEEHKKQQQIKQPELL